MAEFGALPTLLSQFQLPPAPEAPTTVWVALETTGVNWGVIANFTVAFATLCLAVIAVWQGCKTNQIIKATNEQAEGLRQQNDILTAQLEIERARQRPTLIAIQRYSDDNYLNLVNVSRDRLIIAGAKYVTETELKDPNFASSLLGQVQKNGLKFNMEDHISYDPQTKLYTVPSASWLAVSSLAKGLTQESQIYLVLAAAYPDLGPVILALPLTYNPQNGKVQLGDETVFEPLEFLLERLSKRVTSTEVQP